MESVKDRFLRYVTIDTQSDENSSSYPSTKGQEVFLKMLYDEMVAMGVSDVTIDSHFYVMGTIPATTTEQTPTIGFIAHVDTSPDISGRDIKPQVVDYKGGDIVLNETVTMHLSEFSELNKYIGKELITTDGTTLLGADDKAGVAEILSATEYLLNNKHIPHGKIRIAFTADEEIGRGVDFFDVEHFGADFAYTLDGSEAGELEYENFNAASAVIEIQGRNVHPGYAKGKMINALTVARNIDNELPNERPENTSDYEGFFHLTHINGGVDSAKMEYIIRDHDRAKFEKRKEIITLIAQKHEAKITVKDSYYNMAELFAGRMDIIDRAARAMETVGIKPMIIPVRGGTDGSRLSYMGLLTPNIFAGGVNFHGRYEFISTESLEKAVQTIIAICKG